MVSPRKKNRFYKKKWIVFFDRTLVVCGIFLLGVFRPDYVVIVSYFFTIPYLVLTRRTNLLNHLMIASAMAAAWMIIANSQYEYDATFLRFHNLSLYPLFAWAIGLFGVYLLYFHFEHLLRWRGYLHKVSLLTLLYVPLLIGVETLTYHVFHIMNTYTTSYPGLPLCDCIHAPIAMQIAYLAMGPLFFTVCLLFGLEHPFMGAKKRLSR